MEGRHLHDAARGDIDALGLGELAVGGLAVEGGEEGVVLLTGYRQLLLEPRHHLGQALLHRLGG
jgi:hypothetical protein